MRPEAQQREQEGSRQRPQRGLAEFSQLHAEAHDGLAALRQFATTWKRAPAEREYTRRSYIASPYAAGTTKSPTLVARAL